jgi:hypothetical protein
MQKNPAETGFPIGAILSDPRSLDCFTGRNPYYRRSVEQVEHGFTYQCRHIHAQPLVLNPEP